MRKIISFCLLLLLLASCKKGSIISGDEIVRVGDDFLTRAELESFLPDGIPSEDSARLAEEFIRKWIDNELLYDVATKNVPDLADIERKAQEYKQDLIIHRYRMLLVNERVADELSESDIQNYYNAHQKELILEEPLYKGLFLKVRKTTPNVASLRGWMKKITSENLEKIEKFTIKQSIAYKYTGDNWVSEEDLNEYLPSQSKFNTNKPGEVSDDEFIYFYNISDSRQKGDEMPLDYAENQIKELLLKIKATELLSSQQKELYDKALSNKKIEYFYERKN
ncbi:MAG: hypothetical protein ACRC77_04790 [Bacteroidales bacterium]